MKNGATAKSFQFSKLKGVLLAMQRVGERSLKTKFGDNSAAICNIVTADGEIIENAPIFQTFARCLDLNEWYCGTPNKVLGDGDQVRWNLKECSEKEVARLTEMVLAFKEGRSTIPAGKL